MAWSRDIDSAPDGTRVLVSSVIEHEPHGPGWVAIASRYDGCWWEDSGSPFVRSRVVVAWQPLPRPRPAGPDPS